MKTTTTTRAKLTTLAEGVAIAAPSPRIRVLWHHNAGPEHVIAYLGFDDKATADACYTWLAERIGKYDRTANAGVCKPRKAERTDCAWEIKWHSPHAGILATAIEKDLARA